MSSNSEKNEDYYSYYEGKFYFELKFYYFYWNSSSIS